MPDKKYKLSPAMLNKVSFSYIVIYPPFLGKFVTNYNLGVGTPSKA
jgi:hypothetical protein